MDCASSQSLSDFELVDFIEDWIDQCGDQHKFPKPTLKKNCSDCSIANSQSKLDTYILLYMRRLRHLQPSTVNSLTSAKVITCPADVVKELLENSFDAGATHISVQIWDAGSTKIEISDDGSGIHQDDFELLGNRFCSSKPAPNDEESHPLQYGFRGEALFSIANLSKISIKTRHKSSDYGWHININNSSPQTNDRKKTICQRQKGTTVVVEDLFYSLPVRRKYLLNHLRNEQTELIRIIQAYALLCPGNCRITLTLYNPKQNRLFSTAGVELRNKNSVTIKRERSQSICDDEYYIFGGPCFWQHHLSSIFAISAKLSSITRIHFNGQFSQIIALVTKPDDINLVNDKSSASQSSKNTVCGHWIFINSRLVRNTAIVRAVNTFYSERIFPFIAYANKIDIASQRKRLFACIHFKLSEKDIDVHLAPNKQTISIRNEMAIINDLNSALEQALIHEVRDIKLLKKEIDISSCSDSIVRNESSNIHVKSEPLENLAVNQSLIDLNTNRSSAGLITQAVLTKPLHEVSNKNINMNDIGNISSHKSCQCDNVSDKFTNKRFAFDQIKFKDNESLPSEQSQHTPSAVCTVDTLMFLKRPLQTVIDREGSDPVLSDIHSKRPFLTGELDNVPANSTKRQLDDSFGLSSVYLTTAKDCNNGSRSVELDNEMIDIAKTLITDRQSISCKCSDPSINLIENKENVSKHTATNTQWFRQKMILSDRLVYLSTDTILDHIASYSYTQYLTGECHRIDDSKNINSTTTQADISDDRFFTRIQDNESKVVDEFNKKIYPEDFSRMKVIGQFNLAFIITKFKNHLFIVDQHASDECIHFQNLLQSPWSQQTLLKSHTIDMDPLLELSLTENLEELTSLGFSLKIDDDCPAGSRVKLYGLPVISGLQLGVEDLIDFLKRRVHCKTDAKGIILKLSTVQRWLASQACRYSVMFGTALNRKEMQDILLQMSKLNKPWNCAHGRPTMRCLTSIGKYKKQTIFASY